MSAPAVHPLRALREGFCMTQPAFARWVGVSEKTLWNIERGASAPRITTRRRILKRLKLPLAMHGHYFGPLPGRAR